ncbi:MAG: hypothetical protein HW415_1540 [Deltaproteobacteria bacterium]|nr:hypothetical protein [Deltaproteobacteria bacterium]
MDSVMQVFSHEYADEREENSEMTVEMENTSLQDVLLILSVHLASASIGIVIAVLALS